MPYGQPQLDLFVGRDAEFARVAEVVTRAKAGQPWLVAIEGEPGMGKTTLARRCLAAASGLRVLSARADQAETDLDFGLADQLLRSARGAVPAAGTDPADSSFRRGCAIAAGGGGAAGRRGGRGRGRRRAVGRPWVGSGRDHAAGPNTVSEDPGRP